MTCTDIVQRDFNIKRGTDFRVRLRCKDSDGDLVELDGYRFLFKAIHNGVEIDKELTFPGSTGDADLWLTTEETRQVPVGRFMQYAIEIRAPGDTPPGSGDQVIPIEGYLVGEQGDDNDD